MPHQSDRRERVTGWPLLCIWLGLFAASACLVIALFSAVGALVAAAMSFFFR